VWLLQQRDHLKVEGSSPSFGYSYIKPRQAAVLLLSVMEVQGEDLSLLAISCAFALSSQELKQPN
jgi:hypothetical protein